MTEEWRPVVDWEGYEVSNLGRVRSYKRCGLGNKKQALAPKLRKMVPDRNGYHRLMLSSNGKHKLRGVHQLVAEAFLADSRFEGAIVRHKDDEPANNQACNLEWGTPADNTRDRLRNKGLGKYRSRDEISEIKNLYAMGFRQREIARVFRTSQDYVHLIVTEKVRRDVA